MRAHFRSEVHDYASQSHLSRGGPAGLTVDNIKQRIQDAKAKTLDRDS
jgi:hypothetical protein